VAVMARSSVRCRAIGLWVGAGQEGRKQRAGVECTPQAIPPGRVAAASPGAQDGGRQLTLPMIPARTMSTVLLLLVSNVFMTYAWYGHLRHRNLPLVATILTSWGIAFFEYCFQVPANRYGYGRFNAAELKTIQEVISLVVFAVFSVLYLKEELRWNHVVGFALIVCAVFIIFYKPGA
jgi:uncharacterized protein (DUF486 family)